MVGNKKELEVNFCDAFLNKVIAKKGFENKIRYLLEDFFFNEGWASKTNKKHLKEGYNQQFTYNYDTIRHFIEDAVRFSIREFTITEHNVKIMDKKEFIEECQKFNGQIENFDDVLVHIKRLQHCKICKESYWDKICPKCVDKLGN